MQNFCLAPKSSDFLFLNVENLLPLKNTFYYSQVVEGAKARGATQIIGVDVNPDKQTKGMYLVGYAKYNFAKIIYFQPTHN